MREVLGPSTDTRNICWSVSRLGFSRSMRIAGARYAQGFLEDSSTHGILADDQNLERPLRHASAANARSMQSAARQADA